MTAVGRALRVLLAPARWAWRRVHGVRSRMLAIGDGANDVAMIQARRRARCACSTSAGACMPIVAAGPLLRMPAHGKLQVDRALIASTAPHSYYMLRRGRPTWLSAKPGCLLSWCAWGLLADVLHAQAADLGIGIMGKEGRQATNNADFAISQFRRVCSLPSSPLCHACHPARIALLKKKLFDDGLAIGTRMHTQLGGLHTRLLCHG